MDILLDTLRIMGASAMVLLAIIALDFLFFGE